MTRKKVEYPIESTLKASGDRVTILRRADTGGIKAFRVKDTDGVERTYVASKLRLPRGA